jgi:hypothetical protein
MRQAMFSTQGIVDSLLGPLIFLILYRASGLNAALIGAGAASLLLVAFRRMRGQDMQTAWYGVVGVGIGVLLAKATGSGDGYFLPKVASNLFYGIVFLVSALIGKPLIGVAWAFFHRQDLSWGYRPGVKRVFTALTLMWAMAYLLRAGIYGILIADKADRTESLATTSLVLGLPLTGVLLAITFLAVRRWLGPLARPAEPAPQ